MTDSEVLALLVRSALEKGVKVEIDGLGTFRRDSKTNQFSFVQKSSPRVFIAYAHEDAESADRLFDAFVANGFEPWLDRRKLMPGQNWPRAIQNALDTSDFAVTCFSRNSVKKRGGFQAEIRYALDCASRIPLDEIFLVPVRLDDCPVPGRIQREVQYIDLFPDWRRGFQRVLRIMKMQLKTRA
jgi:hypothetical protein